MKVLVTGANGLLGSYVVKELLTRGYHVRVMVRPTSNLGSLEGFNVELFKGQLTNRKDVEKAVSGCSYVIHTAARTIQKPCRLAAYKEVNIDSTWYIIESCMDQGINRLVFVSTANCFGNGTKSDPGNEEKPFLSWLKRSGYAYSKLLAQRMVLKETCLGNIDAVIVNPTFIIGGDEINQSSGQIFSYILNKIIAFYPPGGKNFVDVEAAAYGTVNALEKGKSGECYLLAGENLSYREFFRLSARIAGQKLILIPLPSFLINIMGFLGDISGKFFKRPVQLTSVNARMLCAGNYYTPEKAVNELDLPFVPAEEAVKKSLDKK